MNNVKYERDRQRRWDMLHMRTASCRVPKQDYLMFRRVCEECELTVHSFIKGFIAYSLARRYGTRELTQPMQCSVRDYINGIEAIRRRGQKQSLYW